MFPKPTRKPKTKKPLKRKKPIKRQSKKGAAFEWEFRKMKAEMLPADCRGKFFVFNDIVGCHYKASTLHHKLLRARGGTNKAENLLPVCDHCHDYIHRNPKQAKVLGLLL